ncbi:MAG: hypothetical protein ACHP93_00915 [Solirubrobacterales bacterium]
MDHELIVLLNGVTADQRPALLAELDGVEHRLLTLDQPVLDLAAYVQAAARLEHERLCFLNSYSAILAPGWLAKLVRALDQPTAGLVAATGSWASVRSATLNALFLPNPYRGVVPARRVAREQLLAIELARGGEEIDGRRPPRRTLIRSVLATLRTLPPMPEQLLRFEGFPAKHLRTNAFMAERTTFLGLRAGRIVRKLDAYVLESGHRSFTRQMEGLGLRALVVDRDGAFFDPEDWPRSRTLWQGDQEGLLIADNQTRIYANGGIERRRLLSAFAWGLRADPTMPMEDGPSE